MEDYSVMNVDLAREFIAGHGGTLPSRMYHLRIPGLGNVHILPEDDNAERYWVKLSDIYYSTQWHSPECLMAAIKELPEDQHDLMPMYTSEGETVYMYMVNQDGFYPLLLNNLKHFEMRLSFLAVAWPHIFSLKKKDYVGIPEPLRTLLRFWDIVDPESSKRLITLEDLAETFDLPTDELELIISKKMMKVWDEKRESWVYKAKTSES